jgi:hypothetical protein
MKKTEAQVQQEIRLAASKHGLLMFRNNVGACQDQHGRLIRYGLANDSAQLNKVVKSGDLIGITPVIITPDMIGRRVGIFTSLEIKSEGWHYAGMGREIAQQKWIEIIRTWGGYAKFITTEKELPGYGDQTPGQNKGEHQ